MDLFDGYKILTNEKETSIAIFLKPCLLELSDETSLNHLVLEYINEKHLSLIKINKIEVILKPLHILSISSPF